MPWCPECKEEYREGITICAECGAKLVDELPQEENEPASFAREEQEAEAASGEDTGKNETAASEEAGEGDEADAEYDWDQEEEDIPADGEEEEDEEEEDEASKVLTGSSTYVKKADEYKDMIGTGYTFVILSSIGLIYLLLCQLNILPIHYNILAMIVLVGMFIIFMIIGISSFVHARAVKEVIGDEEEETRDILDWLHEHADSDRLKAMRLSGESEEEYYLRLSEQLKGELMAEYPAAEENYLELLTEEYLTDVFEDLEEEQEA